MIKGPGPAVHQASVVFVGQGWEQEEIAAAVDVARSFGLTVVQANNFDALPPIVERASSEWGVAPIVFVLDYVSRPLCQYGPISHPWILVLFSPGAEMRSDRYDEIPDVFRFSLTPPQNNRRDQAGLPTSLAVAIACYELQFRLNQN
jgi:hypothetical protein